MKRINILLIILVVFLVSCSKQSLEDKTIKRIVANVANLTPADINIVFSNDSLCIAHFSAQTEDGGNAEEIEYFMQMVSVKDNKDGFVFYECLYSLNEHQSLLSMTETFLNSMTEKDVDVGVYKPDDIVYTYASMQRAAHGGRKVPN